MPLKTDCLDRFDQVAVAELGKVIHVVECHQLGRIAYQCPVAILSDHAVGLSGKFGIQCDLELIAVNAQSQSRDHGLAQFGEPLDVLFGELWRWPVPFRESV